MQSLVSVSSSCRLLDLPAEHCSSLYTCLSRCPLKGDRSTWRDHTRVSISDLESGRSQGAKATWPTPSIPAQQGRRGSHEVQDTVVLGWMPRAGGGGALGSPVWPQSVLSLRPRRSKQGVRCKGSNHLYSWKKSSCNNWIKERELLWWEHFITQCSLNYF